MYKIGWFSTGRDKAARDLLKVVWDAIKQGEIPNAKLLFVFCNREEGENKESDKFIKLAEEELGIPAIPLSFSWFGRDLKKNRELKRREYDRLVARLINFPQGIDVVVLAGYMLIVSEELSQRYPMIRVRSLKRKPSLIVETLRLLASGEIKIGEGSRDLTKVINKKIKSRR